MTGFGELAVHKTVIRRERGADTHSGDQRQNQNQGQDTFHRFLPPFLFQGLLPSEIRYPLTFAERRIIHIERFAVQ